MTLLKHWLVEVDMPQQVAQLLSIDQANGFAGRPVLRILRELAAGDDEAKLLNRGYKFRWSIHAKINGQGDNRCLT